MDVTAVAARAVLVTGAVCALGWLVKTALIAANGGTNTDEGLVALCYLVGLTGWILLGASTGALLVARLTGGTSARARVLVVVGAVAGAVLAFPLMVAAVGLGQASYPGSGWMEDELGLLCLGILAGLGAASARRAVPRTSPR
jgi:hypothetical protein